jgi:hypothetical protein
MSLIKEITLIVLLFNFWLISCGRATPSLTATPEPPIKPTVYLESDTTDSDVISLITRLLDNRSPYTNHSQVVPEQPMIRVRSLPEHMPFSLPLLKDTVVIGSVIRPNARPNEVMILLDVPQPALKVIEFYREELARQGFTVWSPGQSRFQSNTFKLFCQKEQGIQLDIIAYENQDKPTDVRVTYNTHPALVSCDENITQMTTYAQQVLPAFSLPDGVVRLGNGSGGGYEGWAYSEQQIITQLSPTELDQFLRPQIEKEGWQLVAENQADPVAWSKWTLTDQQGYTWSGVLIITSAQGSENTRILKFQIERVH